MRKVKEEFNFRGMVEAGFETLPLHIKSPQNNSTYPVKQRPREKSLSPAYMPDLGVDIGFSIGIVSDFAGAGALVLACACLTVILSPSLR
jgi:hypothetical protein